MPNNPNIFNQPVGLFIRGAVTSFDPATNVMYVELANSAAIGAKTAPVRVSVSYPLTMTNKLFIGARPKPGTPVILGQGAGNKYYFVCFLPENIKQIPSVNEDEILVSANNQNQIRLDSISSSTYIGSENNKMHLNAVRSLFTTNFADQQHYTQASKYINGIIRRDKPTLYKGTNPDWDLNSRLTNDKYDPNYTVISLDPSLPPRLGGANKNPPFVESREILYEFQDLADVRDETTESLIYSSSGGTNTIYSLPNRRKSKADTFSLTLESPNYLMETVKGTAVDIFGNFLDINRYPIPISQDQNTINSNISVDRVESYKKIRALQRKGIAFHFELNARKDFSNTNILGAAISGGEDEPTNNIVDAFGYDNKFPNADYGRLRSRFFFDIDKEGQFKLNVPASSEKGNVALLTRYENFCNISPDDNENPDKLLPDNDLIDILQDSFASPKLDLNTLVYSNLPGSINVKDGLADATPKDRRYNANILHGTAYHDILSTCYAHQSYNFVKYQYTDPANPFVNVEEFPLLKNVVTDTIQVGGTSANAGGRSGSINFDGSVEMSIGANTIDRQSLWLDTAGGMVANIGRDNKNMSAAMSMNGDVFIQVGGLGVVGDSRFVKQVNGQIGAVLDLRVFNDGKTVTMFRIDNNGVTLMTPGNLNIYAAKQIKIAGSDLEIDVENCTIQGRLVKKVFGGSI